MKKDAYYFSHDSNAQDDPKCMMLIDQLGMEGYGIFWALIEKLRCEAEYKLPLIVCKSYAKRWATSEQKILTTITDFGLFELENNMFFSLRLKESMLIKSEKARKSISYRWGNNTNVLQSNNERNTTDIRIDTIKGKESKGKKIKVNNIINNINTVFSENFKNVYTEFIEYRKSIKKPLKEISQKHLLSTLEKYNETTAIEMLKNTISNGWTGVFEIKQPKSQINNKKSQLETMKSCEILENELIQQKYGRTDTL